MKIMDGADLCYMRPNEVQSSFFYGANFSFKVRPIVTISLSAEQKTTLDNGTPGSYGSSDPIQL